MGTSIINCLWITEMNETSYPLCWPKGWKRTTYRTRAKFGKESKTFVEGKYQYSGRSFLSVAESLSRVQRELDAISVTNPLVSSNLFLRIDGLPRSGQAEPSDPGVAIYWTRSGKSQCLAIDRYDRVADNLAAIAATLEAMRAINRHGGREILDRAFLGFAQLPATSESSWRSALGILEGEKLTESLVQQKYRDLAKLVHSDLTGGTDIRMVELNLARDAALAELSRVQ
jgi:hypothetical protein